MLSKVGCDVHVFAGSHSRQEKIVEQGVTLHWVKCSSPHDFNVNVVDVFAKEHLASGFDLIESPEIHGNAAGLKDAFPHLPMVVRLHAPNWLVEHLKKKYVSIPAKTRYVAGALRRGKFDLGYWRRYNPDTDTDRDFALRAQSLTAPSEIMKKWAVKNWKIPPANITVLPNPFDPPLQMLTIPISAKEREIVFFGRLNVLKGLVNLTLAMKKLLAQYPGYRFKVIGDDGPGPENGQSMSTWMKTKLKDVLPRVEFVNGLAYEQLPSAIEQSRIVVLPSLFESFSYTCAEAMASGKAVIGSFGTGMEDMICNQKNGMLVNAHKPKAIYDAMRQLIENDELRLKLAHAARESISTLFAETKLKEAYLRYYKHISCIT